MGMIAMLPWYWALALLRPTVTLGAVQINGVSGGTVNLGLSQELGAGGSTNRSNVIQTVAGDLPFAWVGLAVLLLGASRSPGMQAAGALQLTRR